MSLQLEDGRGSGKRAEVSDEFRLRTEAIAIPPQLHASLVHSRAFQALSGVRNVTSPSTYGILALRNNGPEDLAVTYIRVGIDRIEALQAKVEVVLGGTWAAGTAGTVQNLNTKSSLPAAVDAHYNSIPTGDVVVIDNQWAQGPKEMIYNKEGSIILPTGGIISLKVTTETAAVNVHGRISFFAIPVASVQGL